MKFPFGKLVWTRAVNELVASDASFAKFVTESLARHCLGDWGEISAEDKKENDFSLDKHLRLFSVYKKDRFVIWVISEPDRSATTLLFPDEY